MTGYELKDHIWIFDMGPVFFSRHFTHPKCLWPHTASYPMDTWSSVPGEKRPEREAGDQPLSRAEEEHTELYLHCFYTLPCGSQALGQLYTVFTM
jgi:hypothetical protein